MKKIYIILLFALAGSFAYAQDDQPVKDGKKSQEIEALKVAFITKELELGTDEAQKFWPLYNQYSKEVRAAKKSGDDVLENDEKVLNIRKRYKDQFAKILGQERTNRMFGVEGKFRQLLIKAIRKQNKMEGNSDKPFLQQRKQKGY